MTRMQRAAILLQVLEALRSNNSWCGETSLQKTCYLLQEMLEVPLDFEFILYKHGPYSFGLTDELTALRCDGILAIEVPNERYGPRYLGGDLAAGIKQRFPKTRQRFHAKIEFLAARIGGKRVAELERLATALFVRRIMDQSASREHRASRLVQLKPHIRLADAIEATIEIDALVREASREFRERPSSES